MKPLHLDRKTTLLAGIGLVLIGLLAGVLAMMFMGPSRPTVVTQQVQPVQLGQQEPAQPVSLPDSVSPDQLPDTRTLNHLFKDVATHIRPAVVYIQVRSQEGRGWLDALRDEEDLFRRRPPSQSIGSGVIVSEQGHIVTNDHVVDGASAIRVTLADKRAFRAEVVGTDPSTDLAVLKIDGEELPVAALGDSDEVNVGEWVLAVGNPFRLTSTVTAGIVSALGRQVNIINDRFRVENFIQTDAAINPGNSGGALVNMKGELVGISTAIATESGANAGYGFAVPSNLMQRIVSDLIAYGEVRRGFLGVEIREIDAQAANELGLERIGGVYVNDIRQGGAADRAGLQQGDVVLAVGGRRVNAPNELQSAVAQHRPGERLTVRVWRSGKRKTYEVKLMGRDAPAYQSWFSDLRQDDQSFPEEEPDQEAPSEPDSDVFELGEWGIGLQPLKQQDRDDFGIDHGVYVAYVEKNGPAAQAGLPRDVVVLRVAGRRVRSVEEVLNALTQRGPVKNEALLLRVQKRNGQVAFYEVEPPA